MSASDKKKQRKAAMAEGLTQKQRKEQAEAAAAKRQKAVYTAIGLVCAVAAVGLLLWNGIGALQDRLHQGATAAVVGGESYTVADLQFYYNSARNSFYQQAYQSGYLSYLGWDSSVSDGAQWYNEEEGQTYADYFRNSALNNLQQIAALCSAAKAEGYTLSEEGQKSIDDELANLDILCAQYGYTRSSFLARNYGSGVTEKVYLRNLTNQILASEYAQAHADDISYDDAALKAYYDAHPDALDSYDYRYFFISGTATGTTNADGNTVAATDEEKAAAMEDAKQKANEAVAEIQGTSDREAAFVEAAPKYVSENVTEAYENESYSLNTGVVGDNLSSSVLGSWLMDSARKAGDVTSLEVSGSGYYVVLFLNRYLVTDPTVDVRHILIRADAGSSSETNEEGVAVPTQEAMDIAKATAEALLTEWKARPEAEQTAENFGALAEEHSDDTGSNTNGGQYTYVYKGQMVPNFNDWCFDPSRQSGDVGIVENAGPLYYGYHVVYFENSNDPYWEHVAYENMQGIEQEEWMTSLTEATEAVAADGMSYVGPANSAVPSTPAPSEPAESPAA